MLTFPVTLFAGTVPGTRTLTYSGAGEGAATTWSTGTVDLGTPAGTSLVAAVWVCAATPGVAGTAITSISIDGTNGTLHENVVVGTDGTVKCMCGIASRATSNTTGVVTVTINQSTDFVWVAVYRLNNLTSTTPDDHDQTTANSGATSLSVTPNITGFGILLAGGMSTSAANAGLASWSAGVTGDYADNNTANTLHAAIGSTDGLGSETGRTVTLDAVGAGGRMVLATTNWH